MGAFWGLISCPRTLRHVERRRRELAEWTALQIMAKSTTWATAPNPKQVILRHLTVFICFIHLPHIDTGHGPLPQLTGNVSEVLVSSLLQSCYLSSQTLPRVYQHYGPSPIQPLSTEMQILLTVYYLVQLGQYKTVFQNKDYNHTWFNWTASGGKWLIFDDIVATLHSGH